MGHDMRYERGALIWANAHNFRLAVAFKRMEDLVKNGEITATAAA